MKCRPSYGAFVFALFFLVPALAAAQTGEIPCTQASKEEIRLDGLLGDWEGVDGVAADQSAQIITGREKWGGAEDLSLEVFCNHDQQYLYLAVNVKDDAFVRTPGRRGDDFVRVLFAGRTLIIYPENFRGIKSHTAGIPGVSMAEAMQQGGYSVEMRIPLNKIPGYRPGVTFIPGAVQAVDGGDSPVGRSPTKVIGTGWSAKESRFVFAQAKAEMSGFLRDKGYRESDVRFRAQADIVGDKRLEQIVLAGRTIGIIGEGLPGGAYFFLDLPVRSAKDVYWLKVMDLNGDGKAELVTRFIERGNSGWRELIAVYRYNTSNQFVRPFMHEILKGQGNSNITNHFSFAKYRRGKTQGIDIIIDKPQTRGFSSDNYHEDPATDCYPIMLPWTEDKKRVFRFEGDEFFQK